MHACRNTKIFRIALLLSPILVGLISVPASRAQSATPAMPPRFEVASIKPCQGDGAPESSSPGRLNLGCRSLIDLIRSAFVFYVDGLFQRGYVDRVQIAGGPAWINSEHYDINAKAESTPGVGMMQGPMLQALLEDRFKLKIHRETKASAGYAITVAKSGPKLQPFTEGSCTPLDFKFPSPPTLAPGQRFCGPIPHARTGSNLTVEIHGFSLDEFAIWLSGALNRPVVDKSGLTGRFDIQFEFAPDESSPGVLSRLAASEPDVNPATAPPDPSGGLSDFYGHAATTRIETRV